MIGAMWREQPPAHGLGATCKFELLYVLISEHTRKYVRSCGSHALALYTSFVFYLRLVTHKASM